MNHTWFLNNTWHKLYNWKSLGSWHIWPHCVDSQMLTGWHNNRKHQVTHSLKGASPSGQVFQGSKVSLMVSDLQLVPWPYELGHHFLEWFQPPVPTATGFLGRVSSLMMTMSFTLRSRRGKCHFCCVEMFKRYSLFQRLQKCSIHYCTRCWCWAV